ncbi:MAG: hypothetical protein IRY95_10640, partial [Clostridia bacterium]|nr:hypothetical protein [Clostridia bacterium]
MIRDTASVKREIEGLREAVAELAQRQAAIQDSLADLYRRLDGGTTGPQARKVRRGKHASDPRSRWRRARAALTREELRNAICQDRVSEHLQALGRFLTGVEVLVERAGQATTAAQRFVGLLREELEKPAGSAAAALTGAGPELALAMLA